MQRPAALSERTIPVLQEPAKSLFIACIAQHVDDGTYPKPVDFAIVAPSGGYLPETLYATECFLFEGRQVQFGVGAHWDGDQRKVNYECRLKYKRIENKMNLTSIEAAELYFPRKMLDTITSNCLANREKKKKEKEKEEEEARKQTISFPHAIAPLSSVPLKKQPLKKVGLRQKLRAAERKGSSSCARPFFGPTATLSAAAFNLHFRHDS